MADSFLFGMKKFNERVMDMENESTKVTVGLGYTLNLGNFQSLRIDVSVSDNKREGESTNDAFERVYAFVEKKLTDKVAEAQSEADGK